MGRNNGDFTGGRHSGGSSNPKNWGNKDDHKSAKPVKHKPDADMPDYSDNYEERNT